LILLTACSDQEPASQAAKTTEEADKKPAEIIGTITEAAPTLAEASKPMAEELTSKSAEMTEAATAVATTAETETTTQTSKRESMLKLAKKSGCLACHSIDKRQVGPA
jgi:lipoprotein-anchoring transpeptidase ErfK/SrfK